LTGSTPRLQGAFIGNSPINILVRDPQGRLIGFDSSTGTIVNQIGAFAEYSGPGTHPQFIGIPLGQLLSGSYEITGVGTGSGPYTITFKVTGDDPSVPLFEEVVAAGVASLGDPITPIKVIPPPTANQPPECQFIGDQSVAEG